MAESTGGGAGAKVSKVDAVGQALAELGKNATREQIQGFVKERYGYTMTLDHISNCKAKLAKRAAKSKKAGKKQATTKATQPRAAPTPREKGARPAPVANVKAPAIPLDDILVVRSLVDRLGAAPLRTLIDALEP
jgi:hypothetical protein